MTSLTLLPAYSSLGVKITGYLPCATIGIGRDLHLLLAGEVEQPFGHCISLERGARSVFYDLYRFGRRVEQTGVGVHDRLGRQHPWIPEMRQMPLVAVFEALSGQVRTDAPCAEHVRHVIGIFTRLAHRSPAARLAGHRPHVLGMAVPAALSQID